ncbi:MAG: efflux RND transporter permease subunit, partial [Planctomycetes bacterium]|nr:efflux RND transporter permease subunit [Planctomycetota bacterium]
KRPVTTLMMFFVVLLLGGICLSLLPIDLLPELDIPVISVITPYEGAAPEDVETKVTEVLESFVSTVPDLKHILSTSKEGMSVINLSFEWDTDLDTRANDVRDALGIAKINLPEDASEPRVFKFDVSKFPILIYGVTARESYSNLEDILEDQVADPLKRLPGVGTAVVRVELYRQVNVHLDRERLASYNLTPQDVVRAIADENQTIPAGNIKMGLTDYLVRVPGEFKQVEPMSNIVLTSHNGRVVRLADVGYVEDGFEEVQRYVRINGQRGGLLMVQKQSGANTVQVARAVAKRLEELKEHLPADIQLINVMDSSEDIVLLIYDLTRTLLLGGLLAMLVVLVFLRRSRATFVIALTIPFSLIAALVVVFFLGYTINMMTLFGMIVAVGMVVDNAIVILENIIRHREEGERPREGAVYGASEVAMAVATATLTTVCIFFPILFVKGITKIIFSEFAIVVSIILLASLFSALTLTPMLSAALIRGRGADRQRGWLFRTSERLFESLSEGYARLLGWALRHRAVVVVTAGVIFAASLLLVPSLGSEFMPEEDRAILRGKVHLQAGTRVEETARVMQTIERILREEIPSEERVAIFAHCGVSPKGLSIIMGEEGSHIGTFGVRLVPKAQRTRVVHDIAANLRKRIDAVRGLCGIDKYVVGTEDPLAGLILGSEQPLTINIIGDDLEVTDRLAARIKALAEETPGTVDVSTSRVKGKPEVWVTVDRDKASSLGLNVYQVADTVRASIYGRTASKYRVHGDEYDIFVRLREEDRARTAQVLETPVRLPGGRLIRVANLARVSIERGPLEIERKDQGRIVNVEGNVHGRSLGEVVSDLESKMKQLEIPAGVEVLISGEVEEQRESFFWLGLALGVATVLVYMVMASQFESLLHPFVIMFSLPFAFTGVIWVLLLFGHHLNIIVLLGMLLLIGIVVKNAIVLVDYVNILRARGLSMTEAVQLAGRTRLRPVLMTALTTIFALVPMAFGRGQGSEVWNPLGATVMGGLLVSTLVTLVLVPTLYSIFESRPKRARA